MMLIIGFTASMMMPECHQCNNELVPLIFTGIGYSIYASAIWGSVPYVVNKNAVGTAFGLATSIQNIGLCSAPSIVGYIKDQTRSIDHGFFHMNVFFVAINIVGLILNMNLYYIDVTYNNSVLDRVDEVSSGASDSDSSDENKNRNGGQGLMSSDTNSNRSRGSQ